MNKTDLAGAVATDVGVPRETAVAMVEAVVVHVTEALARGEDVRLTGFGNFVVAERKPSVGRNPRTGAPIDLPGCRTPKFRVARSLKLACNR
jgi:DNA-binding protein HU-beta